MSRTAAWLLAAWIIGMPAWGATDPPVIVARFAVPDDLEEMPRYVGYDPGNERLLFSTARIAYQIGLESGVQRSLVELRRAGPGGRIFANRGGSSWLQTAEDGTTWRVVTIGPDGALQDGPDRPLQPAVGATWDLHGGPAGRFVLAGVPLEDREGIRGEWRWTFWGGSARAIPVNSEMLPNVFVGPQGRSVLMGTRDRVRVYSAAGVLLLEKGFQMRAGDISADGDTALLVDVADKQSVKIIVGGRTASVPVGESVRGVRLSPDGTHGLIWYGKATVRTLDVATATLGAPVRPPGNYGERVSSAVVSDDGSAVVGIHGESSKERTPAWIQQVDSVGLRWRREHAMGLSSRSVPEILPAGDNRWAVRDHEAITIYELFLPPVPPEPPEFILSGLTMLELCPGGLPGAAGWPLQPVYDDHPLGATFEYMFYNNWNYQHWGVDILATPFSVQNTCEPWVIATHGGVVQFSVETSVRDNYILIRWQGAGGEKVDYDYHHLDGMLSFSTGDTVYAGTKLARVVSWPCAAYSHLHYGIMKDPTATLSEWINPMTTLRNYVNDANPPEIGKIFFYDNLIPTPGTNMCDPSLTWSNPVEAGGPTCTPLSGPVDMLVEVSDRHRAGKPPNVGDNIGVRQLRYKLCDESQPACQSWAVPFTTDRMPDDFNPASTGLPCAYYSAIDPPLTRSTSDYCSDDEFFVIPTNVGGTPEMPTLQPELALDPAGLTDGFYTLTIEAEDVAENTSERSETVCINNSGNCPSKLVISDCSADVGQEPSPCPVWDRSPDIRVRVLSERSVQLEVCMTNRGCGPIAPGLRVGISATASYTDRRARPFVRTVSERWAVNSLTRGGGPWPVGARLCPTLTVSRLPRPRQPADVNIDVEIVGPGDAPHPLSSIRMDNNKARKKL